MALILGLDIATTTGWAIYDTDKTPSAIVSGSFKLQGATPFERVRYMRSHLPRLIKEYRPNFAAIEAPMEIAPRFTRATTDMLGKQEQ